MFWDHDYDGVVLLDVQDHYPWEVLLQEPTSPSDVHRQARVDPYDVPEVAMPRDKSESQVPRPSWTTGTASRGCHGSSARQ